LLQAKTRVEQGLTSHQSVVEIPQPVKHLPGISETMELKRKRAAL
jgi:hypothetical protein